MADTGTSRPPLPQEGAAKASAGPLGKASNGMAPEVAQVSDILRARSFAKLRNQSNGDLEGAPRQGVPRRVPSLTTLVDTFVADMGGDRAIHSILVANNGVGAVKFMRSVRSWAYKAFGSERALTLVAMATPEDMRMDAEHIRLADQFVEVPGGPNANNYANVRLIVQVAERAGVDAVWPGWGHASENPELPTALAATAGGVRFLGPPAAAMAALGDKVGSTIIAQAAGVPTLPWSGSGVAVDYAACSGVIPDELYQQACVHSLEEALERCANIGYPIMLKASWGGGGKGIRKVMNEQDVRAMFGQVQGEVPGSPVFAMALAPQSRHLEVQLLCDMHGNVTSVHSRDCSVQRRHQKIVEEGPVTAAPQETLRAMEACARALARAVGYVGAATVEFLYVIAEKKYYFLELNPRLQVEHPVTEMISGVNLPAAQVQVGMGLPLHRIPDVRRLFGKDADGSSAIDFEHDVPVPPLGHVVAVRITSEDANDGFKPTCGLIEELSFRSTPEVWGYFSVKSGGGIHEFSDSQFGHLFARGDTRTAAVRAMVVALKEVKIRGEIRTLVDYAVDMIQAPEFIDNRIHTGWLDSRIAAQVRAEKPPWYLAVIAGGVLRTLNAVSSRAADFLGYLTKGQLPPTHISLTSFQESLVLDGKKYAVRVVRSGAMSMRLTLGGVAVEAVVRHLNDGGLLIQVDGQSHVVHSEEEAMGTRLTVDSLTCLLANEVDPSRLTAPSPGKLVRYTVPDGGTVKPDQPYAEVEVMKMFMPMLAPAAGTLRWHLPEGSILAPGDLIARLDLSDPGAVTQAEPFTGGFPPMGPPQLQSGGVDTWFAAAFDAAKAGMAGYDHPIDTVMEDLLGTLDDPALPLLQWGDKFSAAATRLPPKLGAQLEELTDAYKQDLAAAEAAGGDGSIGPFPAQELLAAMGDAVQAAPEKERAALTATLAPLRAAAEPHAGGSAAYARHVALQLLEAFLRTEEQFSGGGTEQEVIDALRREHTDKLNEVLDIVVAHQGAKLAAKLASRLLAALVEPSPEDYRQILRRLAALEGAATAEVAGHAGRLLERSLLGELRAVAARALSGLDMFSGDFAELVAGDAAFAPGSSPPDGRRMTVVEGLYSGLAAGSPPRGGRRLSTAGPAAQAAAVEAKMAMLVEAPAAVEDALASLLVHLNPVLQGRALTTYIRRSYFPFLAKEPTLQPLGGAGGGCFALWTHYSPHSGSGGGGSGTSNGTAPQRQQLRLGAALLIPCLADLPAALKSLTAAIQQSGQGQHQVSTLHVALTSAGAAALKLSPAAADKPRASSTGSPSALTAAASATLSGAADVEAAAASEVAASADGLREAGFDCVSLLANHARLGPLRCGLCWDTAAEAFTPDPLLRCVEPPVAELLELHKLPGSGKGAAYAPSRNRQSHLWAFSERADARSIALKRVFLRGAVRQLSQLKFQAAVRAGDARSAAAAAVEALEPAVKSAMANIERASAGQGNQGGTRADWTHVYLAVLPALPAHAQADEAAIAADLRAAAAGIAARAGPLLRRAAVAQWEVRLRITGGGAWRIVASSPTGHESDEDHVAVYLERPADASNPASLLLYAPPSGITASSSASAISAMGGGGAIPGAASSSSISSLASAGTANGPGPLAGTPILAPYAPLEALQQKRLAARRHKTTFCYDFPSVFANALRQAWAARAAAGEPDSMPPPGPLVGVQELCAAPTSDLRAPWAVSPVERAIGGNDVGIVAWRLALRTPECPAGREVVAIANDITFNSGSFGPREDAVFGAMTEYALQQRLPLVYLAANSGARVGLASEIRACLQVEWQDPSDPAKGFQYLYLSDADRNRLTAGAAKPTFQAEPVQGPNGEVRWRLSDIIGAEEGLGVECLSGSGAIASAYNRAFAEGFTVTLVSGRTVGIGAYLARLGRRVVQRADQPIILTGYAALNKLLGREVYTSHLQLGGPKVMGANGVSHQVVADDLEGVCAVLEWLSFVPATLGGPLPMLPSADPADRSVTVLPAEDGRLDARLAIAGRNAPAIGAAAAGAEAAEAPEWQSGLFDCGSWVEAQAGWARTVITGRARLSGTPVGVIAVESATVMLNVPADPGMPDSSERIIPQAGQVWFPDSAAKTAAAMQEFDKEGLPLFVLANWRGFSGGQRDLFEGVLQAGSLIVDALRTYRRPAFVYLPPGAELRGGAWVVIDSAINPDQVEMYADDGARGGVLEPEGMVEIKFRTPELRAAMSRIDPVIQSLKGEAAPGWEAAVRSREEALLPVYRQVAVAFAAMHDTPARMLAVGVLRGVVPWRQARQFFVLRLRRRLLEEEVIGRILAADATVGRRGASALLRRWLLAALAPAGGSAGGDAAAAEAGSSGSSGNGRCSTAVGSTVNGALLDARSPEELLLADDRRVLEWAASAAGRAAVAAELQALAAAAAAQQLRALATSTTGGDFGGGASSGDASVDGAAALLTGLREIAASDPSLAARLRAALAPPVRRLGDGQSPGRS